MNLADALRIMESVGCSAAQREAFAATYDECRRAKARDGCKRRQAVFRAKHNGSNASKPLRDNADNAVIPLLPSRAHVLYAQKEVDIPSVSLRSTAPKGADAEKRAKRLFDAWEPTEHHFAYAASKGLSTSQVRDIAFEFKNYWIGDGRRKLDWDRTFTNRLLFRASQLKAKAQPNSRQARIDRDAECIRRYMGTDDEPRPSQAPDFFDGATIDAVATRIS